MRKNKYIQPTCFPVVVMLYGSLLEEQLNFSNPEKVSSDVGINARNGIFDGEEESLQASSIFSLPSSFRSVWDDEE